MEHIASRMKEGEDWLLWCRLCANMQTKSPVEIFFKNEEKHDLVKILEQYYCLDVSEDDKLPKTICETCYSSIRSHLSFVKGITKIQEMYSDLLNCGYENKAELYEIRRRYKIDKIILSEQNDIKVGFVDIHPMIECLVTAQNDKNPLDDQSLSNDGSIFNDKQFTENDVVDKEPVVEGEREKGYQALSENEVKCDLTEEVFSEKDVKTENSGQRYITTKRRRYCLRKQSINYIENVESSDEDGILNMDDNVNNDDDDEDVGDPDAEYGDCDEDDDDDEIEDGEIKKSNGRREGRQAKKRKVRKDKLTKKLDCPECPYNSWRNNDMKWHMISKHGRPVDENHKFICTQCSKVFRNRHFLKRHLETHLPEDQRRTWPCPHCDKLFSSDNNAKIHIKHIHFNDKKFICEECGFIAKTNGSLKQHMETHLPVAKYECTECGQRIRSRYRLKVHMDTHNPDRFPCKICNLKFSSRMTLKNHLVIHSDAMPYKCDSCGRGFKLSKYLKSHLLTHTGLKHYSCKFCDRQFAHSANCRLHMKKEHPDELAKLDAEGGPKKSTNNVPTLQALKAFAKTVPSGSPDDEPPLFMF